jgi:hypothetical protein
MKLNSDIALFCKNPQLGYSEGKEEVIEEIHCDLEDLKSEESEKCSIYLAF